MRSALVTTFHDTVNSGFNSVREMMGTSDRDVIDERLEGRGIPATGISTRFDDMTTILNEVLEQALE